MARQPSNTPLIIAVVLALVLLLGANMMAQNNNPEIQERLEKERAEKEAAKQAEKGDSQAKDKESMMENAPATSGDPSDLVLYGERKTLGEKSGFPRIVIGYSWTPAIQQNPSSITKIAQQLEKLVPKASIEVVNIDSNPGTPAGVTVNGKLEVPVRPDGTPNVDGSSMRGLMETVTRAAR
ncbi:MAG: hypothetical protein SFU56_04625 [Capsulimonadales bacterium]|nr:hypothetical protein [Capsulimonadales bacterium]